MAVLNDLSFTEHCRDDLRALYEYAVTAAHPGLALRQSLERKPFPKAMPGGRTIVLAIGKAAAAMMEEALSHLDLGAQTTALLVTNYENSDLIAHMPPQVACYLARHPVPDMAGMAASAAVVGVLGETGADDVVLVLLSGGGAALLPAPVAGISLEDKMAVNRALLGASASISEVNVVRQSLSQLKGGRMAELLRPARLDVRVVSDVVGDDLRVVASGPTYGAVGSLSDARDTLIRLNVLAHLPPAVRAHFEEGRDEVVRPVLPEIIAAHEVIASNAQSLDAMADGARRMGYRVVRAPEPLIGDVEAAARRVVREMRAHQSAETPVALLWGGETTVEVRGGGTGGRNQELALRVALGLAQEGAPAEWVFMSAGTDGRDGPTPATGAIVDGGTLARIRGAGRDVESLLADNDSHRALAASGDLMGGYVTGTNVADVQAFLLPALV